MSIIAKIYPNGEASLYFQRRIKKKNFRCTQRRTDRQYLHYLDFKEKHGQVAALEAQNDARRGGRPLGLVTVPISTKKAESLNQCKGLSRHGARMLRQGAYFIESEAGKDQVTFATATVPQVDDDELKYICTNWSEIVDRFIKRIRYQLQKKGLPAEVIHVTEVQEERSYKEKRDVPHIHLVFQGRKRKRSWAITPKQITKWWKAALQLPFKSTRTFTSTCQLARVRRSVSRYLSKYVAKKVRKTGDVTSSQTWKRLSLKQWWGCTNSIRKRIFKNTRVLSSSVTEDLWRSHEKETKIIWEFTGTISNPWDGGVIVFCRFGRLTKWARQKYLRPKLGIDK